MKHCTWLAFLCSALCFSNVLASENTESASTERGDRMIAAYFDNETQQIAKKCLSDIESWDDWMAQRETRLQQLREMLGLDPMPERTPLQPVVTGRIDHEEFTVENLHFQSRPQLYVTANLYLPKHLKEKAPAILYVCGHAKAVKDGVSFGNKTKYHHHGAWFARNGYVCLVIDTLQLGEIEGVHHGTYRQNMWWWNARGYTPAGVEAWNSIRAVDYLVARPEVDADRIGVTGRSGGGAYSWFLAALDDRIKCVVPVAGITSLKNHVVDGCVEGHCDCMYIVNTYRWDYSLLAALSAPRPLLFANSDNDHIFPLDGVLAIHQDLRRLYNSRDALNELGLHITQGPHKDTQVLQLHAFHWFNRHLKSDESMISDVANPCLEPEQLRVFKEIPKDEINTRIQEVFVHKAEVPLPPASLQSWRRQRDSWRQLLLEKCFAGWPTDSGQQSLSVTPRGSSTAEVHGLQLDKYDFESQHDITLPIYVLSSTTISGNSRVPLVVELLDETTWLEFLGALQNAFPEILGDEQPVPAHADKFASLQERLEASGMIAFVAPRGIGPTAWDTTPLERVHIRRRFMLLGQTLDAMRVWDVCRAVEALQLIEGLSQREVQLQAAGDMAGIALYAALFEPSIRSLELRALPSSHREGPDFLNVLRVLDVPQTVAMVSENTPVRILTNDREEWHYPLTAAEKCGFGDQLRIDSGADE